MHHWCNIFLSVLKYSGVEWVKRIAVCMTGCGREKAGLNGGICWGVEWAVQ